MSSALDHDAQQRKGGYHGSSRPRLLYRMCLASAISQTCAHPSFIDGCGHVAHPNRQRSAHGAPLIDGGLRVSLGMHSGIQMFEGTYIPGMNLSLKIGYSQSIEVLLTVSAGALYGINGVSRCNRQRMDLEWPHAAHSMMWQAPSSAESVQINVTVSVGVTGRFLRAPALIVRAPPSPSSKFNAKRRPAPTKSTPPSRRDLPSKDIPPVQALPRPASHTLFAASNPNFDYALHGALGVTAFGFLFPLTAAVARFCQGCGNNRKQSRLGCDSDWLRQHQLLGFVGGILALASLVIVEVHTFRGGRPHLVSAHSYWGAVATFLAVVQVSSGNFRPAKSTPPSSIRKCWRGAHILGGIASIATGCIASMFGLQKKMASDTPFPALFIGWLVILSLAWLVVELRHCAAAQPEEEDLLLNQEQSSCGNAYTSWAVAAPQSDPRRQRRRQRCALIC
mmetsp:Transcript_41555/g.88670  ORF Transcript_41555/g.88670 Transcript_41555/m.88670 type:complete len:450 (-) Transcript_41555:148-1497(-)